MTKPRGARRRLLPTSGACAAVLAGLVWGAAPSHAATAGTYTSTVVPPNISTVRLWFNSPTFTAPTGTPSTAKITTMDARWGYTNKPNAYNVYVYLCADAANTQCYKVANYPGDYISSAYQPGITAFANYPASTQFHWRVYVDDFQTSSIHAAMNPAMYAYNTTTQNYNYVTVNYSY